MAVLDYAKLDYIIIVRQLVTVFSTNFIVIKLNYIQFGKVASEHPQFL